MTDHPAIVALAKELWRTSCTDVLNRRMVNMGEWDEQNPDVQSGFLSLARAAYAAVLRDLMEPSEAMLKAGDKAVQDIIDRQSNVTDFRPEARASYLAMLRARAREIGAEI